MYPFLHRILAALYTVLPLAALGWAIVRSRRSHHIEPLVRFFVTCFSGVLLGTAIVIIHIVLLHGKATAGEVLGSWYFLIGLLCVMGAFRWVVREASWRLFRVQRTDQGRPIYPGGARMGLANLMQTALLLGIGLPLVAGTLLVHRVRVNRGYTPYNLAECDYENVSFRATDGVRLAGYWVPADPANGQPTTGRTVLMCCDASDTLESQAGLLRVLVSGGYNVLAFDLRGNGESGGQWISFGDVERRDVLGAVRWVRNNHPQDAEHLMAMGGGAGGAAVLAAATDPGGEGRAIDALAVYDTYADFRSMAQSVIDDRLMKPLRPWVMHVMMPIVSANAGSDLARFAPAKLVSNLWPRPILIVHGRGDAVVPFPQGQDLFRAATFPKQSLWLPGDRASVYGSRRGAAVLLEFFDSARPVPAI